MDYHARLLLEMFENMEQLDFSKTPAMQLMVQLRNKLNAPSILFTVDEVEEILANMVIEVKAEYVDDEFIDRASTSFANIITKLAETFKAQGFKNPARMVVSLASQFSVKVG